MGIDKSKLFDANKITIDSDVSSMDNVLEYEQILLSISKTIIKYREEHNLTQKELAQKLNVNQVMISKLERGNYNPTIKLLYNISRKLYNSSDLFISTLKDIIISLYKSQNITYSMKFKRYEIYQNKGKDNITYLVCDNYNLRNGGKMFYGKINNRFTVVR